MTRAVSTQTPATSGMVGAIGASAQPALSDAQVRSDITGIAEEFFFRQAEAAMQHGAAYGAFIILTATLHYLANLAHGTGAVNGVEFKAFCADYLPGYDADSLWHSLRCGFFHRGVPQRTGRPVALTIAHASRHDPNGSRSVQQGCVTLNAESFLSDLRSALDEMLLRAMSDAQLMAKVKVAYEKYRPVAIS